MKKILKTLKKHWKLVTVLVVIIAIIAASVVGGGKAADQMYVDEKVQKRDIVTYHTFTGNIEAVDDVTITPKVMGEVTQVYFKEGDEVKAGDVLAQMDDKTIRQNIALKEASLSNTELSNYYAIRDAKKSYEDYKNSIDNGDNATINQAKAALDNAKTAYDSAVSDYNRAKLELDNNIDASMIAAGNQLESVKAALEQAKKNYDDNEADIRGCEKGVSNAEDAYDADPSPANAASLAGAKANVEMLEAKRDALQTAVDNAQLSYDNQYKSYLSTFNTVNTNLSKYEDAVNSRHESYLQAQQSYESALVAADQTLQTYANAAEKVEALSNNNVAALELDNLYTQLEDYKIKASISGTLTDFNVKVGDTLSTAKAVAEVTDYSTVQVSIKIDEYDILGVEDGVDVGISVDALKRDYEGKITNVSKKATVEKGVSYFTADVEFRADSYIRTGMSVEVKLKNNDVKDVLSVSMDALYYESDNTPYVLVGSGKSQEKKYITTGASDGSYVEIKDGLNEGDTVKAKSEMMNMMMNMYGGSVSAGSVSSDSGSGTSK